MGKSHTPTYIRKGIESEQAVMHSLQSTKAIWPRYMKNVHKTCSLLDYISGMDLLIEVDMNMFLHAIQQDTKHFAIPIAPDRNGGMGSYLMNPESILVPVQIKSSNYYKDQFEDYYDSNAVIVTYVATKESDKERLANITKEVERQVKRLLNEDGAYIQLSREAEKKQLIATSAQKNLIPMPECFEGMSFDEYSFNNPFITYHLADGRMIPVRLEAIPKQAEKYRRKKKKPAVAVLNRDVTQILDDINKEVLRVAH